MAKSWACCLVVFLTASVNVLAAEPLQPKQPATAPAPVEVPRQTIRFRNQSLQELEISIRADQSDSAAVQNCPIGGVVAFALVSAGPFEVTIVRGKQTFERSRLDLHALRRRMRGDIATVSPLYDVETDSFAEEKDKVKSVVGALGIAFPAAAGGAYQAILTESISYGAAMPAPSFPDAPQPPSYPTEVRPTSPIKSPTANPPEAKSPPGKAP